MRVVPVSVVRSTRAPALPVAAVATWVACSPRIPRAVMTDKTGATGRLFPARRSLCMAALQGMRARGGNLFVLFRSRRTADANGSDNLPIDHNGDTASQRSKRSGRHYSGQRR